MFEVPLVYGAFLLYCLLVAAWDWRAKRRPLERPGIFGKDWGRAR